jgi:hydroxymethylglutaryl-CoA lyase
VETGCDACASAVEAGVAVLDASIGGTGGCPFAPNATGNAALHTHALGLANRFRAGAGLSPGSAIVSLATGPDVGALLERAAEALSGQVSL